jgi:branched-chain amino acid aminotransferase
VADEVLICGSAEEVTPVVSVDRIPVGEGRPGPITRQLQDALSSAARGEDPDYTEMLTPVY